MAIENPGSRRTQPVTITHMNMAPGDPGRLADGPLVTIAKLGPGPDLDERQRWMDRLREQRRLAACQAILGKVMEEHRPHQ